MPPVPSALKEEHVEEILLRFPPQKPAALFHAALVCKRWRRLIRSASFQLRYREFHRKPRMLGFLSNGLADPDGSANVCCFVTMTAFCSWPPRAKTHGSRALDARHGRILVQHINEDDCRGRDFFRSIGVGDPRRGRFLFPHIGEPVGEPEEEGAKGFLVSVPTTDERWEVPVPSQGLRTLGAAVLCSDTTGACDHLDCHRGPFLVVFVANHVPSGRSLLYTYSFVTATWNDPISTHRSIDSARLMPSAYVGNALYFGFGRFKSILKYDLQLAQISWIQLPSTCTYSHPNLLFTTTEAGVLGLATIRRFKLYIWSRKDAPELDDAGWTHTRLLDLQRLLPVEARWALREPHVVGYVDGFDVIFFWANDIIYILRLKTCRGMKFCSGRNIYTLFPYMSFCTPALEQLVQATDQMPGVQVHEKLEVLI